MNRQQREVYVVLADTFDLCLCSFCKFYECSGRPCDGYNLEECTHKLSDKFDHSWGSYGIEPSTDCWGFRPAYPVAVCADIVGTVLANKWEYIAYGEMKDGKLIVMGAKS